MKRIFALFFLLLAACTPSANAQQGIWAGVHPYTSFENESSMGAFLEFRQLDGTPLTLIRPYFSYPILSSLNGGSGFDFFSSLSNESRIWQEFLFNKKAFGSKWGLRLRQEFRQRPGRDVIALRLRAMLIATYSINEKLSLIGFDEYFFSERDFDRKGRSDRNWLGARVGYRVSDFHFLVGAFWERVFTNSTSGAVGTFSVEMALK